MRNRTYSALRFVKSHLANRVAAVVAAMVIAVGAVGGIAYAVSSGSSPATPSSTSGTGAPPSSSGQSGASAQGSSTQKKHAGGALARLLARAVHAEVVVPMKGGGYRTVDLDRGTIEAVSSTSITIDPTGGGAAVTAAITSTTHQPKKVALSKGETVVLVYSGGNALIVRPVKTSSTSSS